MSNFINDMINAARTGNPTDFENAFNQEVGSRVTAGINDRRADIVGSMLGIEPGEASTEVPEPNQE